MIDVKKLIDLEYNELITISLIERDAELSSMYKEDFKTSFNMMRTLSKEGKLSDDTKELLKAIFDKIILTKQDLIDKYLKLSNGKVIPTKKVVEPKPKKEKALPRRYGAELIKRDIANQNGKVTPVQNAMLKVNDLKNIYVNLSARGIKAMVGGNKTILSDEDCRNIVSAVTIVERKLETILKRKR